MANDHESTFGTVFFRRTGGPSTPALVSRRVYFLFVRSRCFNLIRFSQDSLQRVRIFRREVLLKSLVDLFVTPCCSAGKRVRNLFFLA